MKISNAGSVFKYSDLGVTWDYFPYFQLFHEIELCFVNILSEIALYTSWTTNTPGVKLNSPNYYCKKYAEIRSSQFSSSYSRKTVYFSK